MAPIKLNSITLFGLLFRTGPNKDFHHLVSRKRETLAEIIAKPKKILGAESGDLAGQLSFFVAFCRSYALFAAEDIAVVIDITTDRIRSEKIRFFSVFTRRRKHQNAIFLPG
jgi:hypothetical protein